MNEKTLQRLEKVACGIAVEKGMKVTPELLGVIKIVVADAIALHNPYRGKIRKWVSSFTDLQIERYLKRLYGKTNPICLGSLNEKNLQILERVACGAVVRAGMIITPKLLEVLKDVVADAIVRYDSSRGKGLKGWVYAFTKWQIRKYFERLHDKTNPISLDEEIINYPDIKQMEKLCHVSLDCSHAIECDNPSIVEDIIPAQVDVEKTVTNKDVLNYLLYAVSKLDEKGRFILNYIINSATPLRCGAALGRALVVKGLMKSHSGKSTRERARILIKQYTEQVRNILSGMGIHGVSDFCMG